MSLNGSQHDIMVGIKHIVQTEETAADAAACATC